MNFPPSMKNGAAASPTLEGAILLVAGHVRIVEVVLHKAAAFVRPTNELADHEHLSCETDRVMSRSGAPPIRRYPLVAALPASM